MELSGEDRGQDARADSIDVATRSAERTYEDE